MQIQFNLNNLKLENRTTKHFLKTMEQILK